MRFPGVRAIRLLTRGRFAVSVPSVLCPRLQCEVDFVKKEAQEKSLQVRDKSQENNRSNLRGEIIIIVKTRWCKILYVRGLQEELVSTAMNASGNESDDQLIECNCCYGDFQFIRMVQCLDGHLFCRGCIESYTRESVYGQGKVSGCGLTADNRQSHVVSRGLRRDCGLFQFIRYYFTVVFLLSS